MITDKVFNLKSFTRQYDALLTISVCDTISNLEWKYDRNELLGKINWSNILGIASILSYSQNSLHLDASLRIAQTCLIEKSCTQTQKMAAIVILDSLTNKPAIDLAIRRNYINDKYDLSYPLVFRLQKQKTDFENSILLNNELLRLNRFQKDVYEIQKVNDTISISAPTSAGKSFILCTILLETLLEKKKNIVYIVPTRALISQVESDLNALVKKYNLKQTVAVSTVPPQDDIDITRSNVFVFTQERLHWFLASGKRIHLDMLIIDEAHKIEDGNRGILLQQKLEEVVQLNKNIKIYFSSPFTSNPEILLDNVLNTSRKEKVNTQFISVNQNLIYANKIDRKPKEWQLVLSTVDKSIILGTIKLIDRPTSELKKIVLVTEQVSNNESGNIIYSNGAADAETTATLLYDCTPQNQISEKVKELIKLVKKTIHRDYALAKVLTKGIAFHYGNMPLLVRREIETLFATGEIKYLVCTSTLLEGVNLPAKSIFIRKPTRGRSNPLNPNDFWNLAGRAGRWGKEYSGNIICIEPENWRIKPNPNKSKQVIKRATDIIEQNGHELIEYIKNGSPRIVAETRSDLEFAFGYYYIRFILNKESIPADSFHQELFLELKNVASKIHLPDTIIKRNPGISPIAQQGLFDYFSTKTNHLEDLVPVYPNDDNACSEYIKLLGRIGKTLAAYLPILNYSRSILLTNWMTGRSLSYLIQKSYDSYQRKEKYQETKTLPVVIRETMDDIETFVRFKFAKDSSCYIDILRYFLELHNRRDLIVEIPELNLWLEFGVSQKTHLSLLSLGLSRNSVIELTEFIVNTEMSKEQAMNWLLEQNLDQLDISNIIIEDIKRVLL